MFPKFTSLLTSYTKQVYSIVVRRETLLVLLLFIIAGITAYELFATYGPEFIEKGDDAWFQADISRVYANMTERWSNHYRVKVHPLYSMISYPPTFLLTKLGFTSMEAVRIVTASIAGMWVAAMYVLLRLTGCQRIDAMLFTFAGASSSAALFFLSVPETYALGSITIISGLALAAAANQRKLPESTYATVSALTLSMTFTNWMVGIFATFTGNPWRRALAITLQVLAIVTLLWSIQKYIFPSAVFFIGDREEAKYIFALGGERVLTASLSFFFHTITAPDLSIAGTTGNGLPILSYQSSMPGSAGILSLIGAALWAGLLALGCWTLVTIKSHIQLRLVIGLSLIGQLLLHIGYGEETFLYSLHFLPILVTLAALTTLTRLRTISRLLVILLIPIITANNWRQLNMAQSLAIYPRQKVLNEMQARPNDPWPRSNGHVVLAIPGSLEQEKAYHEPGGSFSPAVGSFGISLWIKEREGGLITTTDTISLSKLSQSFVWKEGENLPSLVSKTPHYDTSWSSIGTGTWQLVITPPEKTPSSMSLLIRSVGPAGGEVRELAWDGVDLIVNDRWSIHITPPPKAVQLGEESSGGWKKTQNAALKSDTGWGFAQLDLGDKREWTVNIKDRKSSDNIGLETGPLRSALEIDLPDARFGDSLDAQIAHMMMGLVGKETRPGEPTNYPLAWLRDGAYILVALARAGRIQTAESLSHDFAERDFFGGFGSEADAPGLAIWALSVIAEQLNQDSYYQSVWPHILRKATLIEEMLTTKQPIYREPVGEIVPQHRNDPELNLVAEPSRDELIIGRMDHHRPLLFINAVSYRGLVDAADIADHLGHKNESERWKTAAEKLKQAWEKAFDTSERNNPRTYISALWPSWVAVEKRQELQKSLDDRWKARWDPHGDYNIKPLWTYFELAEAHQSLFLGHSKRVWDILHWFWDHQASPGLYTWWEGTGEENSFERWKNIRGWVNPPHVTPHYWTAAEMTLLQLDMLGYIDEEATEPTVVIGAGIPKSWLAHSMHVRGLHLGSAKLDWNWTGEALQVVIHGGDGIKIKPGSSFPHDSKLDVIYDN